MAGLQHAYVYMFLSIHHKCVMHGNAPQQDTDCIRMPVHNPAHTACHNVVKQ